ncbi:MAG: hypothetical protein Kow0090_23360 [Myxococcota bacterium]
MEKKAMGSITFSAEQNRVRGETLGLCQNCALLPRCGFAASATKRIDFCEEFCAESEQGEACIKMATESNLLRLAAPTPSHGEELLGLCKNCAKSGDCSLPKPKGGTWFCEEYK